ncbi:MAG: uncharacterized protein JWQ95_1353 [Sphaerisporangium sp.]|jgi:hypothetical protein|nr:uncharacterized protein [Sphaerisporangium sp.]
MERSKAQVPTWAFVWVEPRRFELLTSCLQRRMPILGDQRRHSSRQSSCSPRLPSVPPCLPSHRARDGHGWQTHHVIADAFAFLQSWYASCCNDDWEHSYGVTIDTLDNPGWHLKIDLVNTPLAGASLDCLEVERTEDDWVQARRDGLRFEGACGPLNLGEMLGVFRDFARTTASPCD